MLKKSRGTEFIHRNASMQIENDQFLTGQKIRNQGIDSSESQLTQTLKTDDKVDERQSTPNALKIKKQLSINASRANDPLMSSESRHKNKSKSFALNKRP